MIADLKSRLLAPPAGKTGLPEKHRTAETAKTFSDMSQVMSWGTPRLVTRGVLDQKSSTFRSIHLGENN
jgi:hypothetical protein